MCVPAFKKKNCRFHLDLASGENISSHGGQVLIDALAARFDLWNSLASIPGLDPRKRLTAGFSASSIVAQMMVGFTSGASCLADMERVGSDQVLMELVGLTQGADQSTLGEWLRAQTAKTVEAVMAVNRTFVSQVLAQATPGRVLLAGRPTVFFDDTEIEVEGKRFEGARLNYEGERALSFQTLWVGPFVADAIFDGAADPSQHLGELLAANASLWQGKQGRFYADSASSAVKFLKPIDSAGFGSWSVSYNKWTEKLEKLAAELPESQWAMEAPDADGTVEGFAWVKHMPGEEADRTYPFATVRRKGPGEMFWRYGFVVSDDRTPTADKRTPKSVFAFHALKGASEQGFSHLLSDLDLHHPPCEKLVANQMFYAIGLLAYNVLIALRVLDLPDHAQGWRPRTIIRNLLTVPIKVSMHARYRRATICIPAGWMRWWRLFLQDHGPKRTHGGARVRLEESGL